MVVAILAVLKAGGAYVPIDLAYPPERVAFMLEDAQAPVLVTESHLRADLPAELPKTICLDSQWQALEEEPTEDLLSAVTSRNTAYIIYTSGSTGRPKGVLVTHHNVVRLLKQTEAWYSFNSKDVWPLFHSYAFDVSVWELWGCLFYGGRLVVVPHLVTRSPRDFYELLAREKVTVLNQTPSAFRQLIWAEETASTRHELDLRYIICAGEALELQSLKPWFDRHGDERPQVINKYGITETTVHSTYRVIRRRDLTNGMGSVIGVPIPDLRIYLVDEDLKPVPSGTPGEICVGGAGVARGYLNRPELTSQRFLPDPFVNEPGARMYRSGDLARVNAEGELEYLGRLDHQVKIRGFRVELGEIESALNRHGTIRESVVIAQETPQGDKRLVAYAVPVGNPPTVSDLRDHLAATLPDYMIPAVFVFLPALPLTNNGKVDRRALPSPETSRPRLKTEYAAPRTAMELALAGIWGEVLNVNPVGIHDNYFELGGDSIRSLMVIARAQSAGLSLSLQELFTRPTIAALAECAHATLSTENSPAIQPFSLISANDRALLPEDVEEAYPLTRLQLGMCFHNELEPLSAMYHDVFSYRVTARFAPEKMVEALQRLAQRHPLLRTSFHLASYSEPLQLVHPNVQIPFSTEDLRHLLPEAKEGCVLDWIANEKRRPFDRTQAPLFRFHLQRLTDERFQFYISFHHSCLDGWSLAAVVAEILEDYTLLCQGGPSTLAPPRLCYRDFVSLELQALASEAQRQFWTERLAQTAPQQLPRWPNSLRAGGPEQRRGPEVYLDSTILSGLRDLAQSAGVPLKTVLLAAHLRVLALLQGQTDIVTGLISNGRPEAADTEKLVGLFLNTVPFRQRLSGGSWTDLVKQTFIAEQETLPYRRFPLSEIQKLHGGKPLLETAFDFVHFHVLRRLQQIPGLNLEESHYFEANNLTTYTTFMLDANSSRLELHIDYDPNALCLQQVEEMTQYYLRVLREMSSDPERRYETFSPLSEAEQKLVLTQWNATARDYPRQTLLQELFEEQAREHPDAVALAFEQQYLTYRELDERASHLARVLREQGLQAEQLVGLCTERSIEMVVGLLGILKAGGAYVPLDPTYPRERLAFMLEDADVRLLLTQSKLREALPTTQAALLDLDQLPVPQPSTSAAKSEDRRSAGNSPLAYVIYTSGSTGKPKGVQVTHRSVINVLTSIAQATEFTAQDNLLAVTTLSFDIAALEIFLPLISGGRVTVASRGVAGDGTRLAGLIETSGASVMQGTPATWRLLLEAGWGGQRQLRVFCGGEALKRNLADELMSRCREVWNFYGPTETTIWSLACRVTAGEPITIGRPLGNTQAYILDAQLQPVPVGTVGELYLGGDGLARGYLNRPELTAERFIEHTFASGAGGRLYRTGDLVRHWPDGRLEYLGRADQQVKIHGFRIEPGEVENALREHAGIAEALVTAREDALGEKRLVGYIISKNGPPSPVELRDHLRPKLPAYMIPAHFVLLKRLPLTPNGKIDLRQLPAPEQGEPMPRSLVPPRNADETRLAEIWQEVLELRTTGIDDNFFDLGGDSLTATRVFARINREFETNFTLQEILEHPTIRLLGELVGRNKGTAAGQSTVIPRQPRVQPAAGL
jgi:amino acid adenylation domain-containing protein